MNGSNYKISVWDAIALKDKQKFKEVQIKLIHNRKWNRRKRRRKKNMNNCRKHWLIKQETKY